MRIENLLTKVLRNQLRCVRWRAFTLIELLMVIAVIGILAALIIAGISSARRKAKAIQCLNNVKILGTALQQFVGDHGFYPVELDPKTVGTADPLNWPGGINALLPGVDAQHPSWKLAGADTGDPAGQKGVWACPTAYRPDIFEKTVPFESYGYNARGAYSWRRGSDYLGLGGHQSPFVGNGWRPMIMVKESEITSPVELYALGDAFMGNANWIQDGAFLARRPSIPSDWTKYYGDDPNRAKRVNARHSGKANIGFADGHAEAVSLKVMFSDNDSALRHWNRDNQPHRDRLAN